MTLPEQMTFIEAAEAGGPEVLRLASGPLPKPAAEEILIRVMAAGVNRPDVLQRKGLYPPPAGANPLLGLEVAGEVVATGEAVTDFRPGDRVAALTNGGGYAEYCAAPAAQCLPWPHGYDAIRSAALPETHFTVWANLFQIGRLAAGESVLVHGGASGIGVTAIQLAAELGSDVFATAGTSGKCEALLRLGADAAINYREESFETRILELTRGRGVDVVLDIVGAPYTAANLRCLAQDGRLVQVGTMKGSSVEALDLSLVMRKRLTVTGSVMRPRTAAEKGAIANALRERVWPILSAGRCGSVIHEVFALQDAAAAHRLMESGAHLGKIVLRVE